MLDTALDTSAPPHMPSPAVVFDVLGVPAPQGSKKTGKPRTTSTGKTYRPLIESSAKVGPWRDAVAWAARAAMRGCPAFAGPVAAHVDFWMPRPTSGVVAADMWKTTYPDVDKLVRSTFDALKTGGVVTDDSLIVSVAASKRMVPHTRGRRDMAPTGARIYVYPLDPAADHTWHSVIRPIPSTPWRLP